MKQFAKRVITPHCISVTEQFSKFWQGSNILYCTGCIRFTD